MARFHRKFADPRNTCITRGRALSVPRRRDPGEQTSARGANVCPRIPPPSPGVSLFNRSSLYHEIIAKSRLPLPDVNTRRNVFALHRYSVLIVLEPIRRLSIFPVGRGIVNEETLNERFSCIFRFPRGLFLLIQILYEGVLSKGVIYNIIT